MAKTLTLDEAADQLGLSVDQFKLNLKTHKDFKSVRPLMGGSSMHFREQDIAELARKIGIGSAPELQMGEAPAAGEDDEQVEIGREPPRGAGLSGSRLNAGQSSKHLPRTNAADDPLGIDAGDDSDDFIPLVDDSPKGRSKARDSDAKVQKGDSAARLENRGKVRPPAGTPTEDIDLEAEAGRSGKGDVFKVADDRGSKSSKGGKSSGKLKSSAKKDDGSEFELQLGADSDSEFELTLADDSDEVDLGAAPRDATGKSGKSGVKLNKPADSGISLEKEEDSDFELNLDSSASRKITGPKSSKKRNTKVDSDSEFELSLDDSSGEVASLNLESSGDEQKDIFATDFDIPALDDSASEAISLDNDTDIESSDFDLEDSGVIEADDSASEVVQLDDELVEVEDDDRPRSKRSKSRRRRDEDDDDVSEALADIEDDEDEPAQVMVGPAQPARWGPLPALVLFPCLFVMIIIMFMGFELLHGMWSYRSGGSKPTYTITRGIAGMFKAEADLPKD